MLKSSLHRAIRALVPVFAVLLALALSTAPLLAHAGAAPPLAPAPTTKVTWLGQAAFRIVTPGGKILVVDPWVSNPLNPSKSPIADLGKVDLLFITHGHSDHVGEAVEIAKATGARLVTSFELGQNLVRLCGFPASQIGFDTLGNPGGELSLLGGEVVAAFTPAVHSSGLDIPGSDKSGAAIAYGGNPVGFVLKIKHGPSIYHTGDTAYFRDMELIGEAGATGGSTGGIDLALINIGGHFGMEPAMAARAAQAVKAKVVVPHHYKTFPILTQDPKAFFQLLDAAKIKYVDLPPGGTLTFAGKELKR